MISQKITTLKTLPLLLASLGIFASTHASAAITTDIRGNTAYDTAAECDAAVQTALPAFTCLKLKTNLCAKKVRKASKHRASAIWAVNTV